MNHLTPPSTNRRHDGSSNGDKSAGSSCWGLLVRARWGRVGRVWNQGVVLHKVGGF